ncbi:hypothetical protein KDA_76750 [Dictyobacter alpinus]|uniref:Uncharacterized protein n=1 Tax=Dictyobacter alpinus TaxID=2014873 RepID=A0A402BLG7_9CHLR|nr:hypothetical protein KDA_76750 [Dictyobacter alpinus]
MCIKRSFFVLLAWATTPLPHSMVSTAVTAGHVSQVWCLVMSVTIHPDREDWRFLLCLL